MASVNKVIILGNVGRDPEVRYTPNGAAICNVSIATTRNWKNKDSGERQEETEWHRVVFFDRLAEVAGEYIKKGSPVYVEGRLKTRKWTDKDGAEKYTTEIMAESLQLLGGKPAQEVKKEEPPRQARQAPRKPQGTGFEDMDSDIPF